MKYHKTKSLTKLFTLTFAVCALANKWINHIMQMMDNITQLLSTIRYIKYLQCYVLGAETKAECMALLAEKYLHNQAHNNKQRWCKEYVDAFQYESEKQDFKNFLNDQDLLCEKIKTSPEFEKDASAHYVVCSDNDKYWIQFDYEKNV